MNQRTAKLINHFAVKRRFNPSAVKREWRRLPRNKRVQMRRMMEQEVDG